MKLKKWILNIVLIVAVLVAMAGMLELGIDSAQADRWCPLPAVANQAPFSGCWVPVNIAPNQNSCNWLSNDALRRYAKNTCFNQAQVDLKCEGDVPVVINIPNFEYFICSQATACLDLKRTTPPESYSLKRCSGSGPTEIGGKGTWVPVWEFHTSAGKDECHLKFTCACTCVDIIYSGIPSMPFSDSSFPVRAAVTVTIALSVAGMAFTMRRRIAGREQ